MGEPEELSPADVYPGSGTQTSVVEPGDPTDAEVPDGEPTVADDAEKGDSAKKASRTWLRIALIVVAAAAAYYALRGRIPDPRDVVAAIRGADLRWVVAAAVAEAASLSMFARQQRRLLQAFGVHMSLARALAVTYSRSAITVSLPAGSAVSAGFAFQQYRLRGASRSTASTVMILSGIASTVGLALLYLTGLLAASGSWIATLWTHHALAVVLWSAATVTMVVLLTAWSLLRAARLAPQLSPRFIAACQTNAREAARRKPPRTAAGRDGFSVRWPRLGRVLTPLGTALRDARSVPARHWVVALIYAAANWLLDLACLTAVARACHLELGYAQLAGAYLAVQIVRQLPVTPGGIGLIETSLLAGLVSAGAAQAPAAAVVLGYRLFSCWLILPIGLVTWFALRLPAANQPSGATSPDSPGGGASSAGSPRDSRGSRALRRAARRTLGQYGRLRSRGPGGVRRPRQRQSH